MTGMAATLWFGRDAALGDEAAFRQFHYERLLQGRTQAELTVMVLWVLVGLWEFASPRLHPPFEQAYPYIAAGRMVVLVLMLSMMLHRLWIRRDTADPRYLEQQYAAYYLSILVFLLAWMLCADPMALPVEGFSGVLVLILGGPALFGPTTSQQRRLGVCTALLLTLCAGMLWWQVGDGNATAQRAILHGWLTLCVTLVLTQLQIGVWERRSRGRFHDLRTIHQQDSELKARADRLSELNVRLEAALAETKALNRRVADAQVAQLAERADLFRELAQYIAGVVHDLRQPLQAMSLQMKPVKQALHVGDVATAERILTRAERALQSMQSQITSLLESATLQASDRPINLQVIDLNALLLDAADMHRSHAEDRGVLMHCVPQAPAVYVKTDPMLLSRVVSNLVHNAIKFSRLDESDQGRVDISVQCVGHAEVMVCIKNSGPLMPQQALQAMHEASSLGLAATPAAQATGGAPAEGFGMGLVIVRNLINRLPHHELVVHSSAEHGNLFQVWMAPEHPPQQGRPRVMQAVTEKPPSVPSAQCRALLKGRYVLILDDDIQAARDVEAALKDCQVRIRSLSHEAQVLALARDEQARVPDLLLFDYNLGDSRTGTDVVRAVRALGWDCPAIIFTGDTVFFELFKDSVLLPTLQKPVDLDQLAQHLAQLWIAAPPSHRGGVAPPSAG